MQVTNTGLWGLTDWIVYTQLNPGLCFVSGSQTKVRMYHYIQNVSSLHVLNK